MKSSKHFLYEIAYGAISLWRKRKLLLLASFLFSFLHPGFSQTEKINVTGTVKDSSGAGMANVTVSERGTNNATSTNVNGDFAITVAGARSVLVFTSVGFATREVQVGNQSSIGISMQSENKDLGEVVVIGYGTRKKESLTGAISTVTAKDLDRVHGGSTVS